MYGHPSAPLGNVIALADNRRTRIQASIKRASTKARNNMRRLDRRLAAQLDQSYRDAVDDLQSYLAERADDQNTLRLEVMQDLLAQAEVRLAQLEAGRNGLLDEGLLNAAGYGVAPFAEDVASIGANLSKVADDAVRFTVSMVAEDGLQLSDRLWAIDQGARETVANAIQRNIIQGHSASQAALEFMTRGERVPPELIRKQGLANADRIGRILGAELMTGEGNAYANALRVFRTEINRAHGEAYQAAAFEHPEVIGTQFLLSPRHPKTDICDMHARVNRYGLGPGVYPKGKNPWPAHPNTLSFVVVVFEDEVTPEHRRGKEDRIAWLKRQDPAAQSEILGSRSKQAALRQGILRESEINTPWRVLKKKYRRKGIDITGSVPNAGGTQAAPATTDGVVIETRVPADFPIGDTNKQAGDITRKMVAGARAHDYQKGADGEYLVRFRHGRRRRQRDEDVRGRHYNKAGLAGLEVDTVNALNRTLHETHQVADALGIPHLRGVNTSAGHAVARMGDGVLSVAPRYNNRHFRAGMTQAEAIRHHQGLLERLGDRLAALAEKVADGVYGKDLAARQRADLLREISDVTTRLKKLRDGVPVEVVTNPPNDWRPGRPDTARPFTSDGYFSLQRDKFKSTVWHEFAHHIHQQLGVNDARSYMDPPLERTLAALARKPGRVRPTRYSGTDHKEWFAESYSLYRLGRSELIDPDLLALIHRIERGEYRP